MDDFDTKRGIALLMGYQVDTKWRIRWRIVFPSGELGAWMYDDEHTAWRDIFDIAGITNGRLFAGE